MYSRFTLILAFLCGTLACSPLNISYDLCSADPGCDYSFYISENTGDYDVFTFLYLQMDPQGGNVLCESNHTLEYEDLWVTYLSTYHYCHNHQKYFDGALGRCVCRLDHDCHFAEPKTQYPFPDAPICVALALIFFGGVIYYLKKRANGVQKLLTEDMRGT